MAASSAVAAVGSRRSEAARAFAEQYDIPHAHGSYDDLVAEGAGNLRIPRDELRHAFVLKPLADIAPHFVDPVRGLVRGGKRLRAQLCAAGWLTAGGTADPSHPAVLHAGTALELFQAAALVHDDVMDGAHTRRGLPAAHRALEEAVLSKQQNRFKPEVARKWVELVYEGFFHDPLKTDLEAFLASSQAKVTGEVVLETRGGRVDAVAVKSPHLLHSRGATYAQSADWA